MVANHSGEGQSARIAERIAEVLGAKGATVDVADAADDPDPVGYDGVIVGDSIHLGRHSRALRPWIGRHEDRLEAPR